MSESLRDQLAANFDNILTTPSDDAPPPVDAPVADETPVVVEPQDVSRETILVTFTVSFITQFKFLHRPYVPAFTRGKFI